MEICPNCGCPEVGEADKFCVNCGIVLEDEPANHCVSDLCHISLRADACYCPRCGAMSFNYLVGMIEPKPYTRE